MKTTNMRAVCKRPWIIGLAFMLAAGTSVDAHDFWIEVSDYQPFTGSPVRIQLKVGEDFTGDPLPRDNAVIERFIARGPDGERQVIGRDGMTPAGVLRLETPGVWTIGYQSRPSALKLPADAFERYLREEGLEHVIRQRAERGEQHDDGRERFARSVKTLIRTGGDPGITGFERQLGLPLEIVFETSPFDASADSASLRLLYLGHPLKDALVVALRKDNSSAQKGERVTQVRTDANGRVRVPIGPGVWLIKAVHMVRVNTEDADWESMWTSVTYRVAPVLRRSG